MLTVKDFATAFDVRRNTIRRWSKDYADFLGPGASPGEGDTRRYTEDDAGVIALIAALRAENQPAEYIRAQLAAGGRGQWPPEGHEAAQDDAEKQQRRMMLQSPEFARMTMQIANLEGQLSAVKELNDKLLDQINDTNERLIETQTQLRLLQQGGEPETPTAANLQGEGGSLAEDDNAPASSPTPTVKLSRWQRIRRRIAGVGS